MKVNFDVSTGIVKPMHATNNGPVVMFKDTKFELPENFTLFNSNFEKFKEAGIPYARTHDSSFYHRWGQEHVIDVYYVFPNFDADPTLPENYDFTLTDAYVHSCALAGTEVFYRLGHRIEHEIKKYGVNPPKDFKKWAIICEHIIRHYTEGWANGYKFKMEYWEIWNEPDLHWNNDFPSPTWTGTKEQFFELYHITATHLKECFPHLKIGGPALAGDLEWAEMFLAQLKAPLDFFSWHCYSRTVDRIGERCKTVRELLDKYGFENAESILNEWNYVTAWQGDDIIYSHDQRKKIKGAAFTAATMSLCQYSPCDMLMYYDARPNEFWNGMFDCLAIGRVLKGYYPFPMFNTLYRLGNAVSVENIEEHGYISAAKNDAEAAVLLTYFDEDDNATAKSFSVDLCGFGGENGTLVEFYLLDESHDLELVGKSTFFGTRFVPELILQNFSSYLIKLKKL